jgi:rhodanese-related sulfurtransferase
MIELEQKDWYFKFLSSKNSLIIDVRTEHEFMDKHINGSLLIDINQPSEFINEINNLDKNKNYFVYCKSGARSSNACKIMNELGIVNTYNLIGGIDNWEGETK